MCGAAALFTAVSGRAHDVAEREDFLVGEAIDVRRQRGGTRRADPFAEHQHFCDMRAAVPVREPATVAAPGARVGFPLDDVRVRSPRDPIAPVADDVDPERRHSGRHAAPRGGCRRIW